MLVVMCASLQTFLPESWSHLPAQTLFFATDSEVTHRPICQTNSFQLHVLCEAYGSGALQGNGSQPLHTQTWLPVKLESFSPLKLSQE